MRTELTARPVEPGDNASPLAFSERLHSADSLLRPSTELQSHGERLPLGILQLTRQLLPVRIEAGLLPSPPAQHDIGVMGVVLGQPALRQKARRSGAQPNPVV